MSVVAAWITGAWIWNRKLLGPAVSLPALIDFRSSPGGRFVVGVTFPSGASSRIASVSSRLHAPATRPDQERTPERRRVAEADTIGGYAATGWPCFTWNNGRVIGTNPAWAQARQRSPAQARPHAAQSPAAIGAVSGPQ